MHNMVCYLGEVGVWFADSFAEYADIRQRPAAVASLRYTSFAALIQTRVSDIHVAYGLPGATFAESPRDMSSDRLTLD